MSNPIKIYKVDSKGKLRFWYAEAVDDNVKTYSGIVGREDTSTIYEVYTASPTNVGKKNERNGVAQAIFEVESLYRAKIEKKRYFCDIALAQGYVSEDVQLAHDYTKKNNHKKIKWGAVDGQYKLDGVRCRITIDRPAGVLRVWSRENKPYILPETLYNDVLQLFADHPKLKKLDGELYKHGEDLEDISSMVKDVEHPERDSLELWLYDTIEPDLTWLERKSMIEAVGEHQYSRIVRVQSFPLKNIEEARELLDKAIELCFEGLMLRNHCGKYKCGGRSYDLQKWKLFEEEEFLMTGVAKDKRGHGVGVFVTKGGKVFNARWKASNAKRQHLADNPDDYVDNYWTVRFHHYSQDSIPIHPVAIVIRDYE